MTKQQMTDSILFALDELAKARVDLEKIKAINIEKHPFSGPTLLGEAVAYNFGRAEGLANNAQMWIGFAIKTLEQCVRDDSTALSDQHGPKAEGSANPK